MLGTAAQALRALYAPRGKFLLAWLFGLQTLALRLVDSTATVGYVNELGARRLPWVWLGDLLLALGAGAAYVRVADRWPRTRLVRRLLWLNATAYLACAALRWFGCSPAVCYALAYVWSAQQVAVLPMALWTLANDLHEEDERARAFPRIAAGESIGHLLGYGVTAWIGACFSSTVGLESGLLLAAAGLCVLAASRIPDAPVHDSAAELAADGGEPRRAEPAIPPRADARLRPLMLSVVFGWVAMSVIVFHVMASLEGAADVNGATLRTLYAGYNFALTLLTLAAQTISGRLLARQRLDAAFIALPAVMVVGSLTVLSWPGVVGAFALSAAMYVVHDAWDLPARHAWLGRVPAGMRGRTTALLDNQAFVAGSVVASVVLGIVCWQAPSAVTRAPFYLGFAALAALAALLSASALATSSRRLDSQ